MIRQGSSHPAMSTLMPISQIKFWLCCAPDCVYTCTIHGLWLYSCLVISQGPDKRLFACLEICVETDWQKTEFKMVFCRTIKKMIVNQSYFVTRWMNCLTGMCAFPNKEFSLSLNIWSGLKSTEFQCFVLCWQLHDWFPVFNRKYFLSQQTSLIVYFVYCSEIC